MNLVQEGLALGIPAPGPDAHQRPSAARIHRMWFGTEGALPADEDLARKILSAFPCEPAAAKINRAHHLLITEALAARGISQVLDIGCGYPLPRPQSGDGLLFAQNTHDVVQQHSSSASVIYVDIDHDVVARRRSLLDHAPTASRPKAVLADVTDMARLLTRLVADGHLTHDRPVAALLHDVLPWIPDDARVRDALAYLRTWLPPGSALAITHATADFSSDLGRAGPRRLRRGGHRLPAPGPAVHHQPLRGLGRPLRRPGPYGPHRPAPEEPPVRHRPRLRLRGVRRRRHQAPVNGSCGKAKPTLPTS
ncbi:SAM-dependent methyltransferase [Streptomyces goshikiensis]|uniref:SAM-dependent methyltransferase n=1 Tax=Streptomyces goshikiensis TaxID=1942 RepID=UPI00365A27C2